MKKSHSFIIIILSLLVLCIGSAYISYSATLRTIGTANKSSILNISFTEINSLTPKLYNVLDPGTPTIENNGTKIELTPTFFNDGEIIYILTIDNKKISEGLYPKIDTPITWNVENDNSLIKYEISRIPNLEQINETTIEIRFRATNIENQVSETLVGTLNY